MSRFIKEKMVGQYDETFRDVTDLAVINTQGIDVKRMVAFRSVLRERGIRAIQIHNRMGRRALASGSLAGIDTFIDGPSTLVWGGSGIVEIARVLVGEARTLSEIQIRGGMSAGEVLSGDQIEAFSRLPSREELIGCVVGSAVGQAARIAAAAMAVGGRLLDQIHEVEQRAPAEETPAEEAKAEEPAADEPPADETPQEEAAEETKPDDGTEPNGANEPPAPGKVSDD